MNKKSYVEVIDDSAKRPKSILDDTPGLFRTDEASLTLIYEDLELKVRAVRISLLNVARAVRYSPQVFKENMNAGSSYIDLSTIAVGRLIESIENNIAAALVLDGSPDRIGRHNRWTVSALSCAMLAKNTQDALVMFANPPHEMPAFFAKMAAEKDPREVIKKAHARLLETVSRIFVLNDVKVQSIATATEARQETAEGNSKLAIDFAKARNALAAINNFFESEKTFVGAINTALQKFNFA